jgi:hypothetical protein
LQSPTQSGTRDFGKTESDSKRTMNFANLSLQRTLKRPGAAEFRVNALNGVRSRNKMDTNDEVIL